MKRVSISFVSTDTIHQAHSGPVLITTHNRDRAVMLALPASLFDGVGSSEEQQTLSRFLIDLGRQLGNESKTE